MMSSAHFPIDDRDLDDAELWDVIDSAAAARSRRFPLSAKSSSPVSNSSFMAPKLFQSAKNYLSTAAAADSRVFPDGEVVQEERWALSRPQKMSRFVEPAARGDYNRMVVVRNPTRTPAVSSPSYPSPFPGKLSAKEVSPIIESPKGSCWLEVEKGKSTHCLSGGFPSVSLFKQYQDAAMAILEKTDYTVIRGNPYIKKSEFLVRAFMQGGRFSDGWGSCERREKQFNKPNHDIPSTAETRAKNKACQDLLGIGEYRPGVKV